jgi:hypothetical protein
MIPDKYKMDKDQMRRQCYLEGFEDGYIKAIEQAKKIIARK